MLINLDLQWLQNRNVLLSRVSIEVMGLTQGYMQGYRSDASGRRN